MLNKFKDFIEDIEIESANAPAMLILLGVLCPTIGFISFFSKGFAFVIALAISWLCVVLYNTDKYVEEVENIIEGSPNGRASDSESEG